MVQDRAIVTTAN